MEKIKTLPFSKWWPFLGGALIGITMRLFFWHAPGNPYAAMMGSFIYLVPILVGIVTVYIAETQLRRSWGYYLWAPFLANVIFVVGTIVILVEGWICAIVIIPLFAILGSFGGLLMGVVCRTTNWPKQTLYSFVALPLILGGFEVGLPLPERISMIERQVTIHAPPSVVWQQIHNARDIQAEEVSAGWAYRIGVPMPLAGVSQQSPSGMVRKITMGKGIHFDQVVVDWQENQYVRWNYRFYDDSFPPHALDEHVRIGGMYFDFKDTAYKLTPQGKATVLTMRMHYRVSTQFNWYADRVARFLLGDVEAVVLDFYRHRSEIAAQSQAL